MQSLEKLGVASLALIWLAHLAAAFRYPLGNDPAIFQYHGWALTVGDVPYRDALDFNTPGIMLLHSVWGAIAGFSDTAFLALTMGLSTLVLWGSWHEMRQRVAPGAALLGLAVGLWAFVGITPWDRGQREIFQGFLFLAAILAASRGWPLWAGIAAGAAVTLKLTAAPIAALLWLAWHLTQHPGRRPLAWAVLGSVIPIAFVLAWLAWIGAWEDYWWIQAHYLPHHPDEFTVSWTAAVQPPLVWAAAIVGLTGALRGGAARTLSTLPLAALVLYLVQRHGWTYHLHLGVPALLPCVALSAGGRLAGRLVPALAIPLIVLSATATYYDHGPGLSRGEQVDDHWDFRAHQAVARYLHLQGHPADRVLTNNDEQQLLYIARRRGATRCLYSFLCSEARSEAVFQQLAEERLAQVREHPPEWVVWNTRPYAKALDTLVANPRLAGWISGHCSEKPRIGPYRIWRCTKSKSRRHGRVRRATGRPPPQSEAF